MKTFLSLKRINKINYKIKLEFRFNFRKKGNNKMLWRIKSFFSRIRSRIFNVFSGRSSLYRVESLRRGATSTSKKEKENISMSVDKGIRKYEKRQMAARGERQYNFFNLKNIIILIILFFTFVYIHMAGYSVKSLYIAIFIFIALTLYLLIVERFKERVEVHDEIKEIKNEREREHHVFLDKVKEIEEVEKNQIENIILKNSDDYDIKVWKIGRATSLLIGKRTPRNKVDIDVSEGVYSNLVSRAHGMLNRVNGVWYYEDLGSQNGSGIEKKDDRRKIKLKRNVPVKVERGDIIYLATTKILLK